jgi:hypothetical protein
MFNIEKELEFNNNIHAQLIKNEISIEDATTHLINRHHKRLSEINK